MLQYIAGIVLLLILTAMCFPLLLLGFLMLGLAPLVSMRFIVLPSRPRLHRTGGIFLPAAIIAIFLTGASIPALVLAASLFAVYILLANPRLADADDKILYNYTILFSVFLAATLYIRGAIIGTSPVQAAAAFLEFHMESFDMLLQTSMEALTAEQRQEFLAQWETVRKSIPYYFYGSGLTMYILVVFFSARSYFYKYWNKNQPSLLTFRTREAYVFILIFALIGEIIGRIYDITDVFYVTRSILLLLGTVYFIAGFLIALSLVEKRKTQSIVSVVIPFIIIVAIFINPLIGSVVGVLDIWFDFRKLARPPQKEAP